MKWLFAGIVLVAAGLGLRRLLRMVPKVADIPRGFVPLSPDREAVYLAVAQEVESSAAIIAVSLNDAIGEHQAGRDETAWPLVRLAATEWERLAKTVAGLLTAVTRSMASARVVVPVRGVTAHRFKSRVMIDYARMHELLDRLVFRSRRRFQLHVRVLGRAVETLTREFLRTYRYADELQDRGPEVWSHLDLYFHDFDLVTKEALLALRALLYCLPPAAVPEFSAALQTALERAARGVSTSARS